jgi:uncharacterized surface protein with fasciclin (FAS1) repeats
MSTTSTTPSNTKNIVDTAAANGSFNTFGKALRQAGMVEKLRGSGPFTLFAPTDAAFDALMKDENKDELVSILNYHVIAGRSSAADVGKLTQVKTISGKLAPIVLKGTKVSIDGAQVIEPDIASSNGMLQGIDKVNIPTRH